jgi:hypothetical protein
VSPEAADSLTKLVAEWVRRTPELRALAVVGSRARGNPRPDSDLDLLVLAADPEKYRPGLLWTDRIHFGAAGFSLVAAKTARYGAVFSHHLRLSPRADVEVSFAAPGWAATNPIDAGTLQIVRTGFAVAVDKDGLFQRLLSEFG